ncbi:MAG: fimbrial protein [Mangrovibacterium sp.]
MASCELGIFDNPNSQLEESEILMRVTVNIPSGSIPSPATKTQTAAECTVGEVKVLVFDNANTFSYVVDGEEITGISDIQPRFNVRLKTSSTTIKLYIVANANDAFSVYTPAPGATLADVRTNLNLSLAQAGITGNLPMAGYAQLFSLDATQANNIDQSRPMEHQDNGNPGIFRQKCEQDNSKQSTCTRPIAYFTAMVRVGFRR